VDYHPTAAELEGFVLGDISAERARAVITHLVPGCRVCGAVLAPYLPMLFGKMNRSAAPPPPTADRYDGALGRAMDSIRRLGVTLPTVKSAEQKTREAVDLLAANGLEGLQDVPSYLLGLPLYEALLERSWALRHEDPVQMVQLAQCATLLADRYDDGELDAKELADLRCRAWIELGNAYRVADELERAEDALGHATELFLKGTEDELLGARFFSAQASLFAARRYFEMACSTQDLVAMIYRRQGDEHLAGRALIMKGIFIGYQGDSEEAIRFVQRGLSSIDQRRDPGLVFTALQCQARLLVDCGRFREARRVLWNLGHLDVGGRVNELKVRWLEGQIHVGLEDFGHAELALQQVKEGFEEVGLKYKAALAGLELGAVWLRKGRLEAAEGIALECTGIFLSLGIRRELLASILVLRKAAETRHLTLALLDQVIHALQEMEWGPGPRFKLPAEP
jgi:tetratricopeptide (TPR) repeat protein